MYELTAGGTTWWSKWTPLTIKPSYPTQYVQCVCPPLSSAIKYSRTQDSECFRCWGLV